LGYLGLSWIILDYLGLSWIILDFAFDGFTVLAILNTPGGLPAGWLPAIEMYFLESEKPNSQKSTMPQRRQKKERTIYSYRQYFNEQKSSLCNLRGAKMQKCLISTQP
jgi:hypothetical protein